MSKSLLILLLILYTLNLFSQNDKPFVWTKELKIENLNNREDSTKIESRLFNQDLEYFDLKTKPLNEGVYPVPDYDLIGKDSFIGLGYTGEYNGIKLENKNIVFNSFFVTKNKVNQYYIKDKKDEVYFTIIVLTDILEDQNFENSSISAYSRNHPNYIGQGFFKTKNNQIDFVSFLTADRNSYAIVNMRLFDLTIGKVILIAPQKDGSLRSMQIESPLLSSSEVKNYVENLLKEVKITEFFTKCGNI
jgi:hypothetical protein